MEYQVINHDYTNTGGSCMVSTFTIWLPAENRTVYLHINDEGGALATCDYVCNVIDYDQSMVIDDFEVDSLELNLSYPQLYKDCYFKHVRKDCEHYKHTYRARYEMLPDNMREQLTANYVAWHKESFGDYFETNGEEMIIDEEYIEPITDEEAFELANDAFKDEEPDVIAMQGLLEYMHDAVKLTGSDNPEELQTFYDMKVVIGYGDKLAVLSNNASIYAALEPCIQGFLNDYK